MEEDKKWWQKGSTIPIELNDVPICENKTTDVKNSDFIELQKKINELIFNFIQEHNIEEWWSFDYAIDDLESLKKYGLSCASCDGSLCVFDRNKKSIIVSM